MTLSEMFGVTSQQALYMAVGAAGILLFLGLHFWRRGRNDQRVRIDLSDRS